jgi:hypothetical protein
LFGGLGNQLFQYAAGRSLAVKHGGELLLDDSLLKRRRAGVTQRDYELDAFAIRARKLNATEGLALQLRLKRPFRYLYEFGLLNSFFTYYREQNYEFNPKFNELAGDLVIEGYWQTERYFSNISYELGQELRPVRQPKAALQVWLDKVSHANSVSLHVRRGDYISNPNAAKLHAVCDNAYYEQAVSLVAECVKNPVFYVFTDDPDGVMKDLKLNVPTVMVSQSHLLRAYEELYVMRHCAHHVIANSAFSWWAAWLSSNPNKLVIAPSQWFRNQKTNRDRIPPTWRIV